MSDVISAVMSNLKNCEAVAKDFCIVKPASNLVKGILKIMKEKGYIGEYEIIYDGRGGKIKVDLIGKINKCGSIRPRYSVKWVNYEKYEKRFLPAKGLVILIVSTPKV